LRCRPDASRCTISIWCTARRPTARAGGAPAGDSADSADPRYANFVERPIWLARGSDRTDCHGGNDFAIGHG